MLHYIVVYHVSPETEEYYTSSSITSDDIIVYDTLITLLCTVV